jgi:transcriptional regulator with PAS, ATPase and Fis domain
LDEIGEMPLDMQTRLLRVIEEGIVSRVGSIKETIVDVRVIAATNKDLNEEVGTGNFRKDLYYRLNVLPIKLIPLRERKDDIPLLSQYFMERISIKLNKKSLNIDEETMKCLLEYEWPGNVRELENIIELMVNTESIPDSLLRAGSETDQRPEVRQGRSETITPYDVIGECLNLEFMEKKNILKALNLYSGNITICAKELGIGRNTLYRKMETYGIKCSVTEQVSNL